jgi:peptidoglycan hydrolase CwlO-like protein
MSSDEEIERRVAALEAESVANRDRLLNMEHYNAGTRILAAGADRDVATVRDTLRGQQRSIQALHADVRDLQSGLREVQSDVREVQSGLREVQSDVREVQSGLREVQSDVRTGFATMAAGFEAVGYRLDRLGGA